MLFFRLYGGPVGPQGLPVQPGEKGGAAQGFGHRQRGQMVAYSEVELLRAENKEMEMEIEKLKRELVSPTTNGGEHEEEDETGQTKNSDGDDDESGSRVRIPSKMKSEEEIQ